MNDEVVDVIEGEDIPDEFEIGNVEDFSVPLLAESEMPKVLRRLDYHRSKENKVRAKAQEHIEKAKAEADAKEAAERAEKEAAEAAARAKAEEEERLVCTCSLSFAPYIYCPVRQ